MRSWASWETPPVCVGVSSDLRSTFLLGFVTGFWKHELEIFGFSNSRSKASLSCRLLSASLSNPKLDSLGV